MSLPDRLRALADALPAGGSVTLDAAALRELAGADANATRVSHSPPTSAIADTPPPSLDWRSLLWIVPAETRNGSGEVCEALGRSRDRERPISRTDDVPPLHTRPPCPASSDRTGLRCGC